MFMVFLMFQFYVAIVFQQMLQKHIEMLHMLQWLYMYVANVCFAIFQVFADAWWVFKSFRRVLQVFQVFWTNVAIVLDVANFDSLCCTCCNEIHVLCPSIAVA